MKNLCLLIVFIIVSKEANSQSNWNIDTTKSKVKFIINGPFGGDVHGVLNSPTGNIIFDPSMLDGASFQVAIDPNSVNTNNKKRDDHLRKPEFLDVSKYEMITFISKKVEKIVSGYLLTGNLKIKDKTKLVKMEFTFVKNKNVGFWKGKLVINRLEFGVGTSSILIGDEIKINIEVVGTLKQ